ncbi:MAG: hypothetical protein KF858_08640 [Candidatus Sumerlaeia bacterium]|nr:hypothetical protein [Candidatus Sumerlaeia bacterium]
MLFVVAAAVALLVGAVATAFALNLATGGFWKLNAIDAMGRGEFNPAFVLESLRSFRPAVLLYRLTPATPVLLGGVGIILLMIVWAIRRLRHQPLFAAFLLSILFDLVLMTKAGSNINYLMGSLTLWGLATVADAFPRGHSPRLPDAKLASLFACAIVLLLVLDIPRTRVLASEILLATPLELDHARQVVEALPPERLLVLDAVWGVPQGVPVPFADTYHAAMLEKEGMLVLTDLADALVERRFRVVIANRFATARAEYHGIPLLPASLRAALVEHYTPAQRGDWLVFWTPKPTEPVP